MSRIKIQLPVRFTFSCEIPLRITDMNYGAHLGNDAVLSIVHEARVQFLKSLGLSEMSLGQGIGVIMADAAIIYKAPAFYGDTIQAEVAVTELARSAFTMVYRMTNKGSSEDIAWVQTGLVAYDYERKRVVSIPNPARERLSTSASPNIAV